MDSLIGTTRRKAKERTKGCTDLVAVISGNGEISTYRIAETTNSKTSVLTRGDTTFTILRIGPTVTLMESRVLVQFKLHQYRIES
jgi:hypothetical protein